jgi:hypothetical protein
VCTVKELLSETIGQLSSIRDNGLINAGEMTQQVSSIQIDAAAAAKTVKLKFDSLLARFQHLNDVCVNACRC